MNDIFTVRTRRLIGDDAQAVLCRSKVAIFGVGGVGGYVLEALCRAGIGSFVVVDGDTISESNINRQLLAVADTVGMKKTEAARRRILSINPEAKVTELPFYFLPNKISDTADMISSELSGVDYIVDAIDNVTAKLMLAELAAEREIPVISSMGTGNRLDPTRFYVTDIYKTSGDPLARVIRHECRKRGISRLKVVVSDEPPRKPIYECEPHDPAPASISFVPAAAGLVIAGEVVRDLIGSGNIK